MTELTKRKCVWIAGAVIIGVVGGRSPVWPDWHFWSVAMVYIMAGMYLTFSRGR